MLDGISPRVYYLLEEIVNATINILRKHASLSVEESIDIVAEEFKNLTHEEVQRMYENCNS